jgi:5-methylcytosine-specific restriction endonuclease McrA
MAPAASLSDPEILLQLPALLTRERAAMADVIEFLVEIERRELFLEQACSSLYSFCMERLGYSEDEAMKRVRVTRLAEKMPSVLDELRSGALHLTGLFLLAPYLTAQNAEALLSEARGKSRRAIEKLLACWFPKPDVETRVERLAEQAPLSLGPTTTEQSGRPAACTCPGAEQVPLRSKLEPLSASKYRVEFTASSELYAKLEQARELLSHALPSGDLPLLLERALDALIEKEVRRRRGSGKKRKRRVQKEGSRHVAVDVADAVWERDASQCTFVDAEGRRCSARRFLTLEHVHPHALQGPATVANITLLCARHNLHSARKVFGRAHIEQKRRERAVQAKNTPPAQPPSDSREPIEAKVCSALCKMGFRKREVTEVLAKLRADQVEAETEPLLRASLALLVPAS